MDAAREGSCDNPVARIRPNIRVSMATSPPMPEFRGADHYNRTDATGHEILRPKPRRVLQLKRQKVERRFRVSFLFRGTRRHLDVRGKYTVLSRARQQKRRNEVPPAWKDPETKDSAKPGSASSLDNASRRSQDTVSQGSRDPQGCKSRETSSQKSRDTSSQKSRDSWRRSRNSTTCTLPLVGSKVCTDPDPTASRETNQRIRNTPVRLSRTKVIPRRPEVPRRRNISVRSVDPSSQSSSQSDHDSVTNVCELPTRRSCDSLMTPYQQSSTLRVEELSSLKHGIDGRHPTISLSSETLMNSDTLPLSGTWRRRPATMGCNDDCTCHLCRELGLRDVRILGASRTLSPSDTKITVTDFSAYRQTISSVDATRRSSPAGPQPAPRRFRSSSLDSNFILCQKDGAYKSIVQVPGPPSPHPRPGGVGNSGSREIPSSYGGGSLNNSGSVTPANGSPGSGTGSSYSLAPSSTVPHHLKPASPSSSSESQPSQPPTPIRLVPCGSGIEDIKLAIQQLTMRSHTSNSTSTYSSLSGSEGSEPAVRRLVRHSSLETINTNVTSADEFVWVDSHNRLVELQRLPWSNHDVLKVLQSGRTRCSMEWVAMETVPRLSYLLQRALVRIGREAQRLSKPLAMCGKHEICSGIFGRRAGKSLGRDYSPMPTVEAGLDIDGVHVRTRDRKQQRLVGSPSAVRSSEHRAYGVRHASFASVCVDCPVRQPGPDESLGRRSGTGDEVETVRRLKTAVAFRMLSSAVREMVPHALQLLPSATKLDTVCDNGLSPLMLACVNNDESVVRILLEFGSDPDLETPPQGSQGCAMVQAENQHWTALTYAALQGHLPIAKLLLERGAHVEGGARLSEEKATMTPLQVAAASGNLEMVSLLLAHGAHPFLSTMYKDAVSYSGAAQRGCYSAFAVAAAHGQRAVLHKLLSHPLNPNTKEVLSLEEILAEGAGTADRRVGPGTRTANDPGNQLVKLSKAQIKCLQEAMYHSTENNHLEITYLLLED
ncbi:unnamed protein product [Nesidiocoris tenuis]|uniref:ABTB2/3 histone-like domain-containing protein n=1 Tax=Nesidiocoris tenuis TaxID=355587 RepID=A0A6H5GCA9_9HEMI|nr:unnamed protein product [Nesidiocoris tenuis]